MLHKTIALLLQATDEELQLAHSADHIQQVKGHYAAKKQQRQLLLQSLKDAADNAQQAQHGTRQPSWAEGVASTSGGTSQQGASASALQPAGSVGTAAAVGEAQGSSECAAVQCLLKLSARPASDGW